VRKGRNGPAATGKPKSADEFDVMTLWLVFALMTAAAVFAVLWPLARRERALAAGGEPGSGSDLAVYRDQLDEIARDRAAGRIGESEAEAARVEVSRRLLAAADAEAAVPKEVPAAVAARHRLAVLLAAVVVLPLGALGLYLLLGSPGLPERLVAARNQGQTIEAMVAQVEAHLKSNPNDARGWEVIAPVYLRLGRFDDAINARRKVLALQGETSEGEAGLGEALAMAANGTVTDEAKAAFDRAASLDHENVKARYYLGVAAEQAGQSEEAAKIWRAMVENAPAGAQWVGFIRHELARVAPDSSPGPKESDVAAAAELSPEQRMAMVRGMVERLAVKLRDDGSDLEGWLRLVRSYMVLGERDKAIAAAGDARRALASDPQKLRQLDELVKGLGLEG
jgi:cytochrome c-type biogenesis protein CcmH